MFDRFKKVLLQTATRPDKPLVADAVSVWAATQGLSYHAGRDGVGDVDGFTLAGKIGNKVWKLEQGCASRNYIHGQQLTSRAELKLNVDVSVIILNRPLKTYLNVTLMRCLPTLCKPQRTRACLKKCGGWHFTQNSRGIAWHRNSGCAMPYWQKSARRRWPGLTRIWQGC